jgi:hypothetical protein
MASYTLCPGTFGEKKTAPLTRVSLFTSLNSIPTGAVAHPTVSIVPWTLIVGGDEGVDPIDVFEARMPAKANEAAPIATKMSMMKARITSPRGTLCRPLIRTVSGNIDISFWHEPKVMSGYWRLKEYRLSLPMLFLDANGRREHDQF